MTRLPSNLRQNHPWMSLQCRHFRSHDKDGGRSHHLIHRSQKPHAACKHHASVFIEWELLPTEVYIAGIGIFYFFGSCDLDLELMTFIYEPDLYSLEIYRMCGYELPMLRLSKVIVWQMYIHTRHTDRQTGLKLYTMPLHGWSINKDLPSLMQWHCDLIQVACISHTEDCS